MSSKPAVYDWTKIRLAVWSTFDYRLKIHIWCAKWCVHALDQARFHLRESKTFGGRPERTREGVIREAVWWMSERNPDFHPHSLRIWPAYIPDRHRFLYASWTH